MGGSKPLEFQGVSDHIDGRALGGRARAWSASWVTGTTAQVLAAHESAVR
jgi:hypothetical protein